MTNCGANGCKNRSTDDPNLTFHRLPAESRAELRKRWLAKLKRRHVPTNLYVCSAHFEPGCFKRDFKVSYNNVLTLRVLNYDSV